MKQGSRWIRGILTQAAFGAVKARDSQLRPCYLRLRSRRGSQVAVAAVARKLLAIMHHLLLIGESYVENGWVNGGISIPKTRIPEETIDEAVTLLKSLGYQVAIGDG